jgi:hypothetical protein
MREKRVDIIYMYIFNTNYIILVSDEHIKFKKEKIEIFKNKLW